MGLSCNCSAELLALFFFPLRCLSLANKLPQKNLLLLFYGQGAKLWLPSGDFTSSLQSLCWDRGGVQSGP